MAVIELFGCAFTAFGPALALLVFTIAHDAVKIIVCMASSFFWMTAILISSLLWLPIYEFAYKQGHASMETLLPIGIVFSVLFQEGFRFLFYLLLKKAGQGLERVGQTGQRGPVHVHTRAQLAYVSGLGYGVVSGLFSFCNMLASMSGPGTIGIRGDAEDFFILSSLLTMCFIFLNTFWGFVFFRAMDRKNYISVGIVIASHMLVSCLTLLNQMKPPIYAGSIIPAFLIMIVMGVWSFVWAGGSIKTLKAFFTPGHRANVSG